MRDARAIVFAMLSQVDRNCGAGANVLGGQCSYCAKQVTAEVFLAVAANAPSTQELGTRRHAVATR